MQQDPSQWGASPPVPPPRDPAGIHSIVQEHRRRSSATELLDNDDMSSDSSSPPDASKRRSSYENVRTEDDQGFYPNKPPPALAARRSRELRLTPSPLHVRASPTCSGSRRASPVSGRQDSWSDANPDDAEPVRRRPASCCCRATRGHRGSLPPVDCPSWGHRSPCMPWCTPSPLPSYWCSASQNWTHYLHPSNEMAFECEDPEQKMCLLEIEKHQLTLQVNVLSDQVEAQSERIMELEKSLSQNKEQLQNCEVLLQKEMSSRSSIESNKLDLMAQISALRLRLVNVENLKRDTEEHNSKLESELVLMCACLAEKEADLANFRSKLIHNGTDMPIYDNDREIEKLKEALSSVMVAYDQKEKKIQEMSTSLNRYKKLHELVLSNSSRKNNEFYLQKLPSVEENFFTALDNLTSCDSEKTPDISFNCNLIEKPPPVPRQLLQSTGSNEDRSQSALGDMARLSPLFTSIRGESPFSTTNSLKYNSSENVHPPTPQKTPPTKRHYSTLPRAHQTDVLMKYSKTSSVASSVPTGKTSHSFHNLHHASVDASRAKPPSGSSFGKGFLKLRLGKRSCSAPELVPEKIDETITTPLNKEPNYKRTSSPLFMHPPKEKSKGFRKIFGRVKRSGSENLNSSAAELKRGGIRATAGPRLGWSEDQKMQSCNLKTDIPFAEWDSSMICDWLLTLGLSMYLPNCKKWVKSGDQLLKATTEDFEKGLNVKNPLHRKKLLLAINGTKEQTGEVVEPAGKIDHQWVIRWLDDIGLPQYKDAFYDGRIDGRMLHHLTLEDLSYLNVTNMLHHISIKTAIQVLRENNFDLHCLKRRSLPEDENTPLSVSKWSNHRVMEWLRNVDLSEYAPNLRGSGVHGGLMLYEPRFNADLMATILNIPPNKTLLRRHLTTQFKQLVGPDIIQKKREWETQPSYLPLSPNAKVKPLKRSPFSLMKRKNKNEFDLEDYVCPLNFSEKLFGNSSLLSNNTNRTEEEKFLMKEMVLKNDTGFESMPASNV